VQPVAGGQAEVRVGGPGDQTNARWSPDGKYLAYLSSHESGSFVYLVPPHGGTPRKLIATNVPTLNNEIVMGDYPWSPDGGTLLISLVTHPGRLTIHRVDRENGAAVPLTFPPIGTEDTSASYSRDGERIVFERRKSGNGMLMVMPSAGGDPETLLEDEFDNTKPAWRPDNRRIVFRSDRGGGNPDLWEFDTSTGKITLLLADTNDLQHYSISADDRLAYAPFRHDTFLFVVDTDTGEKQQLTSHRRGNYGARFSLDDQTLAYQSTRTGDSEIWLHYLDGSSETRITEDPGLDLYPDWSPDGEHLIFLSNRGQDGYKIYIANRDGGGKRLLIDRTVYVDNAGTVNIGLISRWSPDGERIAFLVPGEQSNVLWTIRTDGTDAREILKDISSFDWYRDNRHAIYTRTHGGENEMIAVNLDTGQEQTLFKGPFTEIDVAPDGSAVTFSFGRGHHGMGVALLKLELPSVPGGLPRAAGEPEFVVPAEDTWHVHNPSWSSDSRSIVYTQDQDYGDIYELVERQSSRDD
jgi:Tol biopolymer transport system component